MIRRDKEIKIRLTSDEFEALNARKDQKQLAVWLREVGLNQRKRKAIPVVDPALLRKLASIGNNINQIARVANRREPIETIKITSALIALTREIEGLRHASENK